MTNKHKPHKISPHNFRVAVIEKANTYDKTHARTLSSVDRDVEKLKPTYTLIYVCWECKMVQSLWKVDWHFLKMLNIELPCVPEIPLRYILQRIKNILHQKFYMNIHRIITHNSQEVEMTYYCGSIDEWGNGSMRRC